MAPDPRTAGPLEPARLHLVPYGEPAVEALRRAIGAAKGGDPLAPVSVAVGSTTAALSLRRLLAGEAGILNVRFLSLARVAELLGAGDLAAIGRSPLTPAVRNAAVRRVLAEDPGLFAGVAGHPATQRSLGAAFRDLRHVPETGLARLEHQSARAREVVRLLRRFRAVTTPYYDEHDLAMAAAAAVARGAACVADVGTVVLHLPWSLSPAEAALAGALAGAGRLRAIVGLTGEADADEPARALARRLATFLGPPEVIEPAGAPGATEVVVAPDPDEEARVVLRDALARAAAGAPLHRTAVVFRSPQPYALVLHDRLRDAGIPHHGTAPRTLAQTVAGRTLLGLLDLRAHDLARRDLFAWLHGAPVLGAGGHPVPAARWEALAREAGVVRGVAQWSRRLVALGERRARHLASPEPGHNGHDPGDSDAGADLDHLRELAAFVADLGRRLHSAPEGSWAALAGWAEGLLVRYLGSDTARAPWPEDEVESFDRVIDVLRGLATLDGLDPEPDVTRLRRALDDALDVPARRVGHFGDGIFVGHLHEVVGACFDTVYVVGMTEGRFPPRAGVDPLLTDAERQAAGPELPTSAARRLDERRRYLAALAAAGTRVLTAPRADPRMQQSRLPAPWLISDASRLGSRPVRTPDLDHLPPAGPVRRVPSAEAGVLAAGAPLSLTDHDLAVLLQAHRGGAPLASHPVVVSQPDLARGLEAIAARLAGAPGPWTGFVGAAGTSVAGTERPLSPTSLERWATCPFQYFLGHVLRLEAPEDPDDVDQLSALDRGALVHTVLERFMGEHAGRIEPEAPWSPEARGRLRAIAEELFDEYERFGRTGRPLLWRHQRARILRQLEATLDADERERASRGVRPVAVELAFGDDGADPPVEVGLPDGRVVSMRAKIDRVDATPELTRLVVIDYKTGSDDGYAHIDADPVREGRLLQLPVYALAACQHFGPLPVEAYYWFVSDRAGYRLRGYPLDDTVIARCSEVVAAIAEGIEHGVFPPNPGDEDLFGHQHCRRCAFDRVCAADRGDEWERLRRQPETAVYLRLARPSTAPAEPAP